MAKQKKFTNIFDNFNSVDLIIEDWVKSTLKCNIPKIGVESLLGCFIAQAFSGRIVHDIDDAVKVFLREV